MSLFLKGKTCELRILDQSDEEARIWTKYTMGNMTLRHLLTGSIPVRWIDVKAYWKDVTAKGSILFGIWYKDEFIGVTGLYEPRDIYHSADFRIIIFREELLGLGIGKEATWLCTDYGFRRMNLHRIILGVNEENKGAIKCYEDCGYVKEGVLRDEIYCYGKYSAVVRYGMLRSEWMGECEKRGILAEGVGA